MTVHHPAEVVPGSTRTVVTTTTYITIACGQCGRRFERFLYGQDTGVAEASPAPVSGSSAAGFSLAGAQAADEADNVIPITARRKRA